MKISDLLIKDRISLDVKSTTKVDIIKEHSSGYNSTIMFGRRVDKTHRQLSRFFTLQMNCIKL